ncbi:hypothetical protein V5799_007273 [Amblyomma americanum]|uniref:Uncharacterized protein n=1 Tax=Amblyomma americanum TaxID=6943 RepID=A0AAQ4DU05_AMBAM
MRATPTAYCEETIIELHGAAALLGVEALPSLSRWKVLFMLKSGSQPNCSVQLVAGFYFREAMLLLLALSSLRPEEVAKGNGKLQNHVQDLDHQESEFFYYFEWTYIGVPFGRN